MKRVIVTGGAGYIGSHTVVELAAAGYEPVLVDDLRGSEERVLGGLERLLGRPPRMHRVDCTDARALQEVFRSTGEVHGVIHFAAYKAVGESVADPLGYHLNNVGSLLAVLAAMRAHRVPRIVFSSSCTVYGEPTHLPVDESAPDRQATSPYGSTKVIGESILRDVSQASDGPLTVLLRYFNPIGAHPSGLIGEAPLGVPNNLVPYVTQTAAGRRERLRINGGDLPTPDGTCIRDYIHVVDVARAHVAALVWMEGRQRPLCEVFNLGTGRGDSVLDVVRTFEQVNGVEVPYEIGPPRPGDVVQVYADVRKAREVLGWSARHDLAEALRDAWRWEQGRRPS